MNTPGIANHQQSNANMSKNNCMYAKSPDVINCHPNLHTLTHFYRLQFNNCSSRTPFPSIVLLKHYRNSKKDHGEMAKQMQHP